jgi:hypothetical protein
MKQNKESRRKNPLKIPHTSVGTHRLRVDLSATVSPTT